MGKDEPQTRLLLLRLSALSGVPTGSHLWPLRVLEAVLTAGLRWGRVVIRDSRLRWVSVNKPPASAGRIEDLLSA